MKCVTRGILEARTRVNFNVVRRLNADQAHAMIDTGNCVDEADDLICFALREITATIIERICDQLPKRRGLRYPRSERKRKHQSYDDARESHLTRQR
jgi:hypothetical protein